MNQINKYAVPFNTRKATTSDNVVNKLIKGGVGYLKIELPVNPSINNCIGFKIKVTSEDSKEVLFDGHISGSSSDGYKWIYASYNESEGSSPITTEHPVLFCYRYLDKNNDKEGNVLKSILLGGNDTNWGSLLLISIEMIQATLSTSPDGEVNKRRTSDINEYKSLSTSTNESDDASKFIDGWDFKIGQIDDEIISMSVSKVNKDTSSSIILEGVVTGVARNDESGNVVIDTEFNGGGINLYDPVSDRHGYIVADGSKLVNLDKNDSLKGMTFTSTGFRDPIILKSTKDSDVSLEFHIKDSGTTVKSDVNISRLNLGNWSSDSSKTFSVKTTTNKDSVRNINLEYGGLGLINNGLDTDLYVGTGSGNKLVGGVKFCNNKDEFDSIDKIDGRIVIYEDRLYACKDGSYKLIKFSDNLSLDEVKNGYFYEKVNADAQLGGEIVRLKYDDGLILSNDIHSHLVDNNIHISKSDRDRWNSKLDPSNSYTKTEVDNKLKPFITSSHYHGYHNPVNEVLPGDHDFTVHKYPYGHRILVREYNGVNPYIKIAGDPNKWIGEEEFKLGDRVVATTDDYPEYSNIDNRVVLIGSSSGEGSSINVVINSREPNESDVSFMRNGDWYIFEGGYQS